MLTDDERQAFPRSFWLPRRVSGFTVWGLGFRGSKGLGLRGLGDLKGLGFSGLGV